MFKVTSQFLPKNDVPIDTIYWFLAQDKQEMTIQELKEANCPRVCMEMIAKYLYLAGKDRPDNKYHDDILQALLEIERAPYLYLAGKDWPNNRYKDSILQALLATGEARYFLYAGENWPDSRYHDDILQALLTKGDAYDLFLAGQYWSNSRYKDSILQALLNRGETTYLACAGLDWPGDRFKPKKGFLITLEFLEENYFCKYGIDWFLKQNKPEMSVQDLKEADCSIHFMGWIAECLYHAGLNWPDERYNEDILKALLATGYAAYISLARDYWPGDRFHNPSTNKERK